MPADSDPWLVVGRVAAPFGIRGEIKIRVMTDFPERFTERPLYVGQDRTRFEVTAWRAHGANVGVLALKGISSRDDAEALRNAMLYAHVDDAVRLPKDEYYVHEIVGLAAYTDDGRVIGVVVDVIPTGSNDVYVVKSPDEREILIPAIKEVIKKIDLGAGSLVIRPIEGLEI